MPFAAVAAGHSGVRNATLRARSLTAGETLS
jgi:hypothetical protein